MATAPTSRRLNLTRDQLAQFLTDQQQIRQFELLFSTVDELQVIVGTDFEYQADTAAATANEALAQLSALAQDTAVEDAVLNAKVQQALDAIPGLAHALELLALAPRQELGTIASQNSDNVNITGGLISGLDAPLPVASGGIGVTTAAANLVFAGPTAGAAAPPSFRSLVVADIPALTSGSSILYGNGTGGFSNVTIGTGVSFVAGTLSATGSGGDVVGPASSTDNAIARYNLTTGKLIQNSLVIVDDTGSVTGVNSLTAESLTVNNNATLGFSNTDTLDVRARIISDLEPNTNNAKDIGTSGRNWRDGFFGRNLDTVNLSVTGTTSFDGAQGTSGQVLTSAGAGNTPTWTTPTTGTITAVSVVSANGLAGTSSGGATPALTLTTTITGLLKGNGTAISAAVAGTDYLVPSAPVTKTANFTVADGEVWLINNKSGSSCTVTLPTPSTNTGRVLNFQNYQAQTLVSASSNVVPLAGGSAGTAILQAVAGANATLVSDGTSWIMTKYDSNNSLELE
jgi:hypothetical protein